MCDETLKPHIEDLADGVSEVLCADDVLMVDQHVGLADIYMQCTCKQGLLDSLQLNWDKLMLMSVNGSPTIRKPDGQCIYRAQSMSYLGGLLSDDSTIASELGRRIGLSYFGFSISNVFGLMQVFLANVKSHSSTLSY